MSWHRIQVTDEVEAAARSLYCDLLLLAKLLEDHSNESLAGMLATNENTIGSATRRGPMQDDRIAPVDSTRSPKLHEFIVLVQYLGLEPHDLYYLIGVYTNSPFSPGLSSKTVPKTTFQEAEQLSRSLMASGQYVDGVQAARNMIALAHTHAERGLAYNRLSVAFASLGEHYSALEAVRAGLRFASHDVNIRYLLESSMFRYLSDLGVTSAARHGSFALLEAMKAEENLNDYGQRAQIIARFTYGLSLLRLTRRRDSQRSLLYANLADRALEQAAADARNVAHGAVHRPWFDAIATTCDTAREWARAIKDPSSAERVVQTIVGDISRYFLGDTPRRAVGAEWESLVHRLLIATEVLNRLPSQKEQWKSTIRSLVSAVREQADTQYIWRALAPTFLPSEFGIIQQKASGAAPPRREVKRDTAMYFLSLIRNRTLNSKLPEMQKLLQTLRR